jgi:hypothetical protein
VTIANLDGPLLVADVVTAPGNSVAILTSRVNVTSDDPNVRGNAVLRSFARKGKQSGNFLMTVKNLTRRTTYSVFVNGLEVTTVRSNVRGAVLIRKLPGTDLSTVTSVELRDDLLATVAQANF